jgi:hypothetical protein
VPKTYVGEKTTFSTSVVGKIIYSHAEENEISISYPVQKG